MADLLEGPRQSTVGNLMPVYTYKCKTCSELVDKFHGFDDTMKDKCACGGKLVKTLRLSGVAFKGNGFYRTDSQTNKPGGEKK